MPVRRHVYQPMPYQNRKVVYLDPTAKQLVKPQTTPASIIQQAIIKGVCYKCKEPWFPGHKQVCKMGTKAQVQAIQEQA